MKRRQFFADLPQHDVRTASIPVIQVWWLPNHHVSQLERHGGMPVNDSHATTRSVCKHTSLLPLLWSGWAKIINKVNSELSPHL